MPGAFLMLSLIFKAAVSFGYDDIVINLGIRGYHVLSGTALVLVILFLVLTVILGGTEVLRLSKERKEYAEEVVRRQEAQNNLRLEENKKGSYLDTSGQLVERLLRDQLKEGIKLKWRELEKDLNVLYDQSVKMDMMQENLANLLKKNGAERLDDAEGVLNKAEQYLLQNIRKVLNYMEVCDSDTDEGVKKVKDSAVACRAENENVLKTTSDFLIAMTEYLNEEGTSDGLSSLMEYKDILLNTLDNKSGSKEPEKIKLTI